MLIKIPTYSFDFSITTHCQSRCIACPRTDDLTHEPHKWLDLIHLDFENFKTRIENLRGLYGDGEPDDVSIVIQLCGEWGDPMMHPEIDTFLEYLEGCDHIYEVMLNTNGGLRQPAWYERAAQQYKKLYIVFGLDGIDHDTNWLYRKGVDFNRAWENMLAFRKHSDTVEWQFIIFTWNFHQIEDAKRIAKEIDVTLFFVINTNKHGRIDYEQHRQALKQIEGYD